MPLELFLGQPDDESPQSCGIMLPGVKTGFIGREEFVIVECDDLDRGGSIYAVPIDDMEPGGFKDPREYMTAEYLVDEVAEDSNGEHTFVTADGAEARVSAVYMDGVVLIPIPFSLN